MSMGRSVVEKVFLALIVVSLLAARPVEGNVLISEFMKKEKIFASPEKVDISHRSDLRLHAKAASEHRVELVLARQQRNLDILEGLFRDVSDPRSAQYGKYLSKQDIRKLTSDAESAAHVSRYLTSHGVTIVDTSPDADYITAEGPVAVWETIFSTEFFEYEKVNIDGGASFERSVQSEGVADRDGRVVRAQEYALPMELVGHVSTVFNLVDFPRSVKMPKKRIPHIPMRDKGRLLLEQSPAAPGIAGAADVSSEWYPNVYPALLSSFYNISQGSSTGKALSSQAVFETAGQSFSPSDLALFQQTFGLPDDPVSTVIGGHNRDTSCVDTVEDCTDGNLNTQYIMAIAQNISTTYYYSDSWMLHFVTSVAAMEDPPLVFSFNTVSPERDMTSSQLAQFNAEAMKLGAMGVTLVAASGDDGAAGLNARDQPLLCAYEPMMPASSPYVTAVGATMGPEAGLPEVSCQSDKRRGVTTSGGGFSNVWLAPDFQRDRIKGYFKTVDKAGDSAAPVAGFAQEGRGYPDVALIGTNYLTVIAGTTFPSWGTAASAPVFAGMVSLINAERLGAGKSPLGWINPVLYDYADEIVLNDITSGDNKCQAGYDAQTCCAQGFSAAVGWDPVTGLGSVDYGRLKSVLMALGDWAYAPTEKPTKKPDNKTNKPSALPSAPPTELRSEKYGMVVESYYSETDCKGTPFKIVGMPVSNCLIEYNAQMEAQGSMQYTCDSERLYVAHFSDTFCSHEYLLEEKVAIQQCSPRMHNYSFASFAMGCEKHDSVSESMFGAHYVVKTEFAPADDTEQGPAYGDSLSCAGSWTSFTAYIADNNVCILSEEDPHGSYIYSTPGNVSYFSNKNCEGEAEKDVDLNLQCEKIYYSDDFYAYDRVTTGDFGMPSVHSQWAAAGMLSNNKSSVSSDGISAGMQALIVLLSIGIAVAIWTGYRKYSASQLLQNQHQRLSDNSASGLVMNPVHDGFFDDDEEDESESESAGDGMRTIQFR